MKVCEICGKQYRGTYGLRAEYRMYGDTGMMRCECCACCARKIVPRFIGMLGQVQSLCDAIRKGKNGAAMGRGREGGKG